MLAHLAGEDDLLPGMKANLLIADKAYGADKRIITKLNDKSKAGTTSPKANKKIKRGHYQDIYKKRHLIENFFAKLKQFRTIATRYDKTM